MSATEKTSVGKTKKEAQRVEKIKEDGVIEDSRRPWLTPVFLAINKDKSTRFCMDVSYRKDSSLRNKKKGPRWSRIYFIKDSASTWSSPVILVMKKNEPNCFCVDLTYQGNFRLQNRKKDPNGQEDEGKWRYWRFGKPMVFTSRLF